MSAITWDVEGTHLYETGIDHVVLFTHSGGDTPYDVVTPWNGVSKISEKPSGAEPNAIYADNIKYLNLLSVEEFGATLEAYQSPSAFGPCDGVMVIAPGVIVSQQRRKTFGLCYRTKVGNDVDGDAHGEKLHIIYNCLAAPSETDYETVNDSPAAATKSWEISTTPVTFEYDDKQYTTAHVEIDWTSLDSDLQEDLSDLLYDTTGHLPLPEELIETLTPSGTL